MRKMSFLGIEKKNVALWLLEKYRRILLFCFGYTSRGVMPAGIPCHVEDPTMDLTHGDVVHPCVRYIEEGFEGHKWWMVYTPYYAVNNKLENPRLCYADTPDGGLPTEWKFYCSIAGLPESGYNSDPTMLFLKNELYVFWRENETQRAKELGCTRITVGCKVCKKIVTPVSKHQLMEDSTLYDREVSPTFIARKGAYRAFAIHVEWNPKFVYRIPSILASKLFKYKIVYILDALGLCDLNNSHGVAVWESNSLEQTFQYLRTVQFKNASKLYQPWHMDIFKSSAEGDDVLYAVVQSRQRHARICLARSIDGETFSFYDNPLLTSKTIGMIGLYKPTAIQINDKLILYYTALDNEDNNLHRLFMTSIDWKSLLCKMKNI